MPSTGSISLICENRFPRLAQPLSHRPAGDHLCFPGNLIGDAELLEHLGRDVDAAGAL
jgi:hypothetical protein